MKLTITSVTYPTDDSVTIYFKKIKELESYKSGQHALLNFHIGNEKFTRTYSFHTAPHFDADPGITARVVKGGKVSDFLRTANLENIVAEFERMDGQFFIEPSFDNFRHLIMFAGGSGITPIMSMIKSVLHGEPMSKVSLIYSNRSEERIIFKEELHQLQLEFADRFKLFHVITQPAEIDPYLTVFYKGQLNKLIVRKTIKNLTGEYPLPTEVYICGPYGFMQMIEEAVVSLNLNLRVNKEIFFIPQDDSLAYDYTKLVSREIVVQWRDQNHLINVPSGQSILTAALNANLKLPHSCKEGQCGTCRSVLLSGEVKMRKNHILVEEELLQSQILICHAYPVSEGIVIRPMH